MCDVGNNIRKYRKLAKLTQEELGIAAGLSTMSVRRYESNNRKPNVEQLRKIADALKLPLSKLLDGNFDEYIDEIVDDFSTSDVKVPKSMQVKVNDKYGIRIQEAIESLKTNPTDPIETAKAASVLDEIAIELGHKDRRSFMINTIIEDINDLNEKGLSKVISLIQDLLLIKNYIIENGQNNNVIPMAVKEDTTHYVNAAHPIEDASAEDKQFDEGIMDDENF